MREIVALKETLSKIETLAEAALFLTANEEERKIQSELINLIEEIAAQASLPSQHTHFA